MHNINDINLYKFIPCILYIMVYTVYIICILMRNLSHRCDHSF